MNPVIRHWSLVIGQRKVGIWVAFESEQMTNDE